MEKRVTCSNKYFAVAQPLSRSDAEHRAALVQLKAKIIKIEWK